jgi:hypothetical protein
MRYNEKLAVISKRYRFIKNRLYNQRRFSANIRAVKSHLKSINQQLEKLIHGLRFRIDQQSITAQIPR